MDFMQNVLMGAFNPRQNLIQSSQRGGLPEIIDMLQAYPAPIFSASQNRKGNQVYSDETSQISRIEEGNKVIFPLRVLQEVTDRYNDGMPNPLIFSLSSLKTKNTVYVGVLEFGEQDVCILPFWLFEQMELTEGETLRVGLVNYLEKATFVKLRPHKTEFINLPDPRSILEFQLRNHICLTLNKPVCIMFMGKQYYFDVLELKPKTQYNAAVLMDTDLNLEFATPLDYVEPPLRTQPEAAPKSAPGSAIFEGTATRLDGKVEGKVQAAEAEFDPRKHRIARGIRREWNSFFQGQGVSIGGGR